MTTGRRARVANAAPRKPTVAMTPMSNMIDAVSTRRHPSRDLRGSSARADVHRPRTEVPIPTRRIAAPPTNSYCQGDPPGDSVVGGLPEKSFITSPNVRRAMAGDWHALRAEAVLQRLAASPLGLSSREARERLARVGPNELVQTARISPLRILLSQFTDVLVGDRRNLLVVGTTVDGGRGKAVVVETGMGTELGKIAGLVQQEAKEETPLQRQLERLGRQIGIAVLAAAGLIFLIGILREPDPSHIELLFLTAVGLAVAAIPEGLPAIVMISLAIGLQRMIRRHALVRKDPPDEGVPTKGEMNV